MIAGSCTGALHNTLGALRLAPTGVATVSIRSDNGNSNPTAVSLTLSNNPDGSFRVCLHEGKNEHCTVVHSMAEAYAAQRSLQRALDTEKLAMLHWDRVTGSWGDGGDAA